ncbi:hypothetical protein FRD01_22975 [Microvenator marinus]|uniref:Uncharacterized protein n=1 Tax=Microvenator marinus TaxID=2600177 RepID=A0A5B8XX61_9DELT|nr:hypothetical protein [Microvenator marinus]QED30044.1 hypothetical protein FRD01_22975 [Microvenator marinus]
MIPIIRVTDVSGSSGNCLGVSPTLDVVQVIEGRKPLLANFSQDARTTNTALSSKEELRALIPDVQSGVSSVEVFNLSGYLVRTERFMAGPTSYFTPGKSRTYERITIEDANSERVFQFESQGVRGEQIPLGIAHQTLVRLYRTGDNLTLTCFGFDDGKLVAHQINAADFQGAQIAETSTGILLRIVSGPDEIQYEIDSHEYEIRLIRTLSHGLSGLVTPSPCGGWVVQENGEFVLVTEEKRMVLFEIPELLSGFWHSKPPSIRALGDGRALLSFNVETDQKVDHVVEGCRGAVLYSSSEVVSTAHTSLGDAFFGQRPGSKHYFDVVLNQARFDAGNIIATAGHHAGNLALLTSSGKVIWSRS